jgi:hypothetical protein
MMGMYENGEITDPCGSPCFIEANFDVFEL